MSPAGSVFIPTSGVNAAERNREYSLICLAQGGPGNTVSWTKMGESGIISEDPELVLSITGAEVGGTYQCTVENPAGSDSAEAVVNGELQLFDQT